MNNIEDIKPMTVEEMIDLFREMLKVVHENSNDTKLGRKIRKTVIDFGIKKYNIKKEK